MPPNLSIGLIGYQISVDFVPGFGKTGRGDLPLPRKSGQGNMFALVRGKEETARRELTRGAVISRLREAEAAAESGAVAGAAIGIRSADMIEALAE